MGLFVIAAGLAAVLAVVPTAAGASSYVVLSGSMEPAIPVGSFVVTRATDVEEIRTGDVISYAIAGSRDVPTIVTHRVVERSLASDGSVWFRTRGDANEHEDAQPVTAEQVRGTAWYVIPGIGWIAIGLSAVPAVVIRWTLAAVLLLHALVSVVAYIRERRDRARTLAERAHRRALILAA